MCAEQITVGSGGHNPIELYGDGIVHASTDIPAAGSGSGGDSDSDRARGSEEVYQPTLGPTWHHCVSTRLTMATSSRSLVSDMLMGLDDGDRQQHVQRGFSCDDDDGAGAAGAAGSDGAAVRSSNPNLGGLLPQQRVIIISKCPIAGRHVVPVVITSRGILSL